MHDADARAGELNFLADLYHNQTAWLDAEIVFDLTFEETQHENCIRAYTYECL
jgi:hypothetical protein